ncbi:hypothetical protein AB0M20_31625 [Actinoplanes sp. NPDC051633]|uniref:hypothetical protein n=1 Tax=Actinoplanes sp. NPDC051633 TaxID=3155670 RepID=UPI003415491E
MGRIAVEILIRLLSGHAVQALHIKAGRRAGGPLLHRTALITAPRRPAGRSPGRARGYPAGRG